ncbi:peptide ABC transporter permease [bacterium SCN 62-11]|nr:ABC transporter permease [Candidatus Eremiobacteraeota bacterium]ODT74675.1 MAG: peptide ABC transporter permease [bacterium SCN 62-11]
MKRVLLKRLTQILPVLFGISLLVFLMLRLIPGDPARIMLGERAAPAEVEQLRQELGLDRSLPMQYLGYAGHLARGDLGRSMLRNTRVSEDLARTFPATVELACAAMAIAIVVGVGLGSLAAVKRNSWWDSLCGALSLIGVSIPIFWLGLVLLLIFPAGLGWFAFSGRTEASFPHLTGFYVLDAFWSGSLANLLDVFKHLVLPALTLSTVPMAMIARMTRSALIDVLSQDYIRLARAKGLPWFRIWWRHAVPNAMIPVVTVIGLQFGYLLGGAVLTESVFEWPGLGRLVVEAVRTRDYPVVQGGILLISVTFCLVNVVVDLLYAWLDPRVKKG